MLPSFRLIAAAFLCGFVLMLAGLRLVASLHNVHQTLPVTTAQAAPLPIAEPTRNAAAAVPVLFDLRFLANAIAPMPASVSPQILDTAAPAASTLVSEDRSKGPAPAPAASEIAEGDNAAPVAALDPQPAVGEAAAEPPAAADVGPKRTWYARP